MRSPLGALLNKTPVPFVSRASSLALPFMRPTGQEAQMRAMGSVGTLFAIVNRTSKAEAGVEWKLYRKAANGRPEDRAEVTSHAVLDLLAQPNPFMTWPEFVETFQQHKLLTGEAWWVIARNPRSPLPLELWPVRPDRMEPVPHPTDFISGYRYRGPGGEQVPLETRDVIFLRTPNPMDPYRGMGPVQSILTDLDATRYSAEWNRNFFLNSAEPGGIIEVPEHLSDPEWDDMLKRWDEQHKGVGNAHRVAFVEHGKWVDRKFTQRDMQFAELRDVSREVIREAFGFPKPMLGAVDDVNRANADAGEVMFARWLVKPDLDAIKHALNGKLLPLYGPAAHALEFDYCNPVPDDREADARDLAAKSEAVKALVEAGAYGPAALAAVGLPDIPFGAPDANPERELLIKLVTDAPAALAPLILPLLGIPLPDQADPDATPTANARRLAEVIQKLYLGVDTVLTWEEARQVAADAGIKLDPRTPRPVPPAPARPPAAAGRALSVFDIARERRTRPALNAATDDEDDSDTDGADALEQMRRDHADALERLLEDWQPIEDEWVDALGEQIEQAVDDQDPEALASLVVGGETAAGVLRGALAAAAQQAAERVAEEARRQGVEVDAPEVDGSLTARMQPGQVMNFGDELVGIAAAVAGLLAASMAASATAEALRRYVPGGPSGRTVASAVKATLRGLKGVFRRDQLGGAVHRAQNVGRLATLKVAPRAVWKASERNDTNTCGPCAEIDGTVFDSLTQAWAAYGTGPYVECEGGIRCRGTIVAEWETS